MAEAIKYLINQFDLQSKLFRNVTAEISDDRSIEPINRNTTHIAWLTGHTVSTRYDLAKVLGIRVQEPFPDLFRNGKGVDKAAYYPSMKELTRDWESISGTLKSALETISEEALDAKRPQPVPDDVTIGDYISFILHHEAYTLGQLGLFRRFHGLEPMKYT